MNAPTVMGIVEWVLKNRRDGAFNNYTVDEIYLEICECVRNKTMCYVVEEGHIVGLCCGKILASSHVFHVYDILATKKGALKKMLNYFVKNFPDYSIEGLRKNGCEKFIKHPKLLLERL